MICRAEIPAARAIELAEFMDGLPVIYDCYQDDWGWMSGGMYAKIDEYISDPGVALLTKKDPHGGGRSESDAARARNAGAENADAFQRSGALAALAG